MGEIEHDIPIPAKLLNGRPKTAISITAWKMKPGDSVLCENIQERDKLKYAMYYRGYRVRTEPVGCVKYRVWRVE